MLDGRPHLRTPEGTVQLDRLDVVFFPKGPDGAHKVWNESDEPARVLMWSTLVYPSATVVSGQRQDRRLDRVQARGRDGEALEQRRVLRRRNGWRRRLTWARPECSALRARLSSARRRLFRGLTYNPRSTRRTERSGRGGAVTPPTAPHRPTAPVRARRASCPRSRPARSHGLIEVPVSAGGGAVSRMNCSIAAAMAAASSEEAAWRSSMRGLAGLCFPLRPMRRIAYPRMPDVLVFPQEAVLQALEPEEAIERVRDGFVEYAGSEWQMPPKTYLDAFPHGDFRAMPAKGAGLAILKWVTSFPANPAAGLPVVMGVICVSSISDGRAARPGGRALHHRAADRRRGGCRSTGTGARGRVERGDHRLRPARHVGRPLPGRGGVRPGHLLRPGSRGGGRARRASSGGRSGAGRTHSRATWSRA